MKSSRKAGSESEAVIGKEAAVFILTRKRGIFGHLVVWRMFVFLFTFWLDNAMVLVFLFFPLTIVVLDWPCPTLVILWNCFSTAREHQTVLDAQSCRTLCDPMDGSPPGSSVHGIFQQEYWHGLSFPTPGDLPNPGIESVSLTSPALAGRFFTNCTTWEAQ